MSDLTQPEQTKRKVFIVEVDKTSKNRKLGFPDQLGRIVDAIIINGSLQAKSIEPLSQPIISN